MSYQVAANLIIIEFSPCKDSSVFPYQFQQAEMSERVHRLTSQVYLPYQFFSSSEGKYYIFRVYIVLAFRFFPKINYIEFYILI